MFGWKSNRIYHYKEEELIIGFEESHYDQGQRYAVGVKRHKGGAITVSIDALSLLNFRKEIGVGRLMQDIGDYEGIAYIVLQDEKGIIMASKNAEQLFQIPAEQTFGKTCRDLIRADISPLERTLKSGESLRTFEMNYWIGERNAIVSMSTSVLFDNQGQVDTAVAVIKDLTEQKALEENWHRKEKLTAMGELASGVAHEIRNPLNAIGMVTQRLAREFEPRTDAEEYQQLTQTVVNEVRRINEIIQQFLRFARPPELNLTETDVNELIQSTLTLVSAQTRSKGINLEKIFQPVPKLLLDQDQTKQALLNLLQNSLDATHQGGRILVQSGYEHGEATLIVADTGVGIPKENLNKIFNLYFTTKEEGTGLGLSLVHQIISQHNGRIHVESEVGQGTTVVICLPVSKGKTEV